MAKVKSIKFTSQEDLFDITVKDNHNFFANGILVHNCHRWAKNVQDALLPCVEDGTIIMIGSTTEKPQFALNAPLLSRLQPFELKHLTYKDMLKVLFKVIQYYKKRNKDVRVSREAAIKLVKKCGGDVRRLMTTMETIIEVLTDDDQEVVPDLIDIAMPDHNFYFDKNGNEHFDYVQNMQCAIQCSDASSAVYWLAMAISSGEVPEYLARRILISSSEDCQDPYVSCIANNAYIAAKEIGYPECKIVMSHAVIAIAKAKRDRTAIDAISKAMNDIENGFLPEPAKANSNNHVSESGYTKVNRKYVIENL